MPDIALRPESPSDEPFIRRLVLATIALELGADAWPEPMRSHLLGIQYTARRQSHRANFPEAESKVIRANGEDAGWVIVTTLADEIHLIEIMIMPEMRGQGIGTQVIQGILDSARDAGKPVRLHVNAMNRGAIQLYERLGFRQIGGDEVQQLMEAAAPR